MASEQDSKTEQPTQRRLSDAEKKGDIPRSKDMALSMGLFVSVLFFAMYMPYFSKTVLDFWKYYLGKMGEIAITSASIQVLGKDFFFTFLKLVIPVFLVLISVVFLVEIIQAKGIKFITSNIQIKWEKVFFWNQVLPGIKKVMISVETGIELFKAVVKITAISLIAYYSLRGSIPAILDLTNRSLGTILDVMGRLFLKITFNISLFLVGLSVFDFLLARYRYMKKLRMSKQDIKDEFKQMEGDPEIKSKQRSIRFRFAMRRMMQEVPKADVVITNPTHFAVAIKYDSSKMHSPQVIAKGQDRIALRIREIAKENKVPVVENPPVARAIFDSVELGDFIPNVLFKPVAEILAYIYKLKGKRVN